jgi:hypothetical protein
MVEGKRLRRFCGIVGCGIRHRRRGHRLGGSVVVDVSDDDGDGDTAFFDGPEELTFVPDPDWDRPTPSSDEPWEVACDAYGDTFDASF